MDIDYVEVRLAFPACDTSKVAGRRLEIYDAAELAFDPSASALKTATLANNENGYSYACARGTQLYVRLRDQSANDGTIFSPWAVATIVADQPTIGRRAIAP